MSIGANKQLLCDVAFDEIYRRVITMEYDQGQVLHEKKLMEELAIGRTPIREALHRLVARGIVATQPSSRSWTVRSITLQDIKAVFDALEIMEIGVIGLAVRQPNPDPCLSKMAAAQQDIEAAIRAMDILSLVESNDRFHMAFYEACRNEYMVYGLTRIRFETKRLAYISYSQNMGSSKSSADHFEAVRREHGAVMEHLRNKEADAMRQICRIHIAAFRERIVQYLNF